jgi:hypothetical protein
MILIVFLTPCFDLRHPTPTRTRFCQSVNLTNSHNSHSDIGQQSLEAMNEVVWYPWLFSLETLSFTAFPSILKEEG